jgi:uncharacterized protein YbjT (DUF2867 family)
MIKLTYPADSSPYRSRSVSKMPPSILVAGATGNTGYNTVLTLSSLLPSTLGETHRIIALTRDASSSVAQRFSQLPFVEVIENDWTTIDAAWLNAHNVVRAFIASHNLPHQYSEESALLVSLLTARVEYVVRISTAEEYVTPSSPIYYGRTHWAIENMLAQPEFEAMQWTSLRPNCFASMAFMSALLWLQEYKQTGVQKPLPLLMGKDDKVAIIDANDVGKVAATLLSSPDPSPHNQKKYVLRGPENTTGADVVALVESVIGDTVQEVQYRDESIVTGLAAMGYPERLIKAIREGLKPMWAGKWAVDANVPTSKEMLELCPPATKAAESFKALLSQR